MKSTRGNTMERKLGSRKWFSGWNLSNTYTHQGMEELEIKRISLMQVWCAVAVIQSLSHIWFFETPDIAACQASPFFMVSQSLLRLTSIESVMPSNHLMHCHHPLLLPSVFPSITLFSSESALLIRWPKVLELQLQHQSFQWIFRVDFL